MTGVTPVRLKHLQTTKTLSILNLMPKNIKDSLLIITISFFAFLWSKSPLADFSLQLSAFLFLVFLISKRFFKKTSFFSTSQALFFTLLVLILVFDTGGLSSPIFFLVYFLLFCLSLLSEPQTAFILSLTLIILFLFSLKEIRDFTHLIPLFSLPFITPLAIFFGREHQRLKATEKELAHDEKQTLLWLTTTFKEHLSNISEYLQNISTENLDEKQKQTLKEIEHNAKRLKSLGEKLKSAVEGELK